MRSQTEFGNEAGRQEKPIDLLLTDLDMPGMSGPQLAVLLSRGERPVKGLYLSDFLDDTLMGNGLNEKGLPFLHKSFKPSSLLGKVQEVLAAKMWTADEI